MGQQTCTAMLTSNNDKWSVVVEACSMVSSTCSPKHKEGQCYNAQSISDSFENVLKGKRSRHQSSQPARVNLAFGLSGKVKDAGNDLSPPLPSEPLSD